MRRMRQASMPRKILVAVLTPYPDTGESGEAYDTDVQTLLCPREDTLSILARSLRIRNSQILNSESGEAYEAEVEACLRDQRPTESGAAASLVEG
jgi:hypothetical protein